MSLYKSYLASRNVSTHDGWLYFLCSYICKKICLKKDSRKNGFEVFGSLLNCYRVLDGQLKFMFLVG